MKIEKINDKQIRCVLTKEDLEIRKIRLSELVCGGEKARGLLKDMMLQASRELGFSFNNNPLMIEAVPTGKDQLVLIITKVDDPGVLDSRFKGLNPDFGQDQTDQKASGQQAAVTASGADDILNLLKRFKQRLEEMKDSSSTEAAQAQDGAKEVDPAQKESRGVSDQAAVREETKKEQAASGKGVKTGKGKSGRALEEELYQYTRFYLFKNLENVLNASKRVPEAYTGENSLYKNPDDGAYYLLVKKMDTDPEQFNRICNVLSEYSMPMDYSSGMDEFFREHMQVIVAGLALQHLRGV